ncbi:MAG: hypothetical protein ACAH88_10020, partial [Roseimicrobium sp.]
MLNSRIAEHYGIDGVRGEQFQRVSLPKDSARGGVLTQASVLKITANGWTCAASTRPHQTRISTLSSMKC